VMNQLTLSRFFAAHVMIFPPLLFALITAHIIALRNFGSVGPWDEAKRAYTGPFWPDQVFKDVITATVVFLILLALVAFAQPAYYGQADTLDSTYVPKAEWNFLFLYESLKYFPGRLEPVGSVGVPTVLVLALVLLPFIDRKPQRNPLKRPIAILCGLIYLGFLGGFTIAGYYSKGYGQMPVAQKTSSARSSEKADPPPAPAAGPGGQVSPPTSEAASKGMPGRAATIIGSPERGKAAFRVSCMPCHGNEGKGGVRNPGSDEGMVPSLNPIDRPFYNADPNVFAENLDRFLQHGSVPSGSKPALRMPAFGDTNSLTQQEISNLEAYVMSLNNADRAKLINPGMTPRNFFFLVIAIFVIVALILGGIRAKRQKI
jgi:mono/diheme cytochrome c family protein